MSRRALEDVEGDDDDDVDDDDEKEEEEEGWQSLELTRNCDFESPTQLRLTAAAAAARANASFATAPASERRPTRRTKPYHASGHTGTKPWPSAKGTQRGAWLRPPRSPACPPG